MSSRSIATFLNIFNLRYQILQSSPLTRAHSGLWVCTFQYIYFKRFQGVTELDFWQCLYCYYTFGLECQGLFCRSLFISCTLHDVLSSAFSRLLFIQLESFFPWAAKKVLGNTRNLDIMTCYISCISKSLSFPAVLFFQLFFLSF